MHFVIAVLLLLAVVFLPGFWVRHVMRRYSRPDDRYPGTGGELVMHLADRLGLVGLTVEETKEGDHYDPKGKVVRLSRDNYHGASLTAVTVAAHEVGHALQDRDGYGPLRLRTRLVERTRTLQRLGAGLIMAAPLIALLTRALPAGLLMAVGGMLSLGSVTLVHLVTLPTEFDASFGRAMPLLEQGNYLRPEDREPARRLLRAAAFTYVATSLMSLLNVARWWAILRR